MPTFDTPDLDEPVQTLRGPLGVTLTLDAEQIVPEDQGCGTPLLFSCGGETMTWGCGYDGGNLAELLPNNADLAPVFAWCDRIAADVEAWETEFWDRARAKTRTGLSP